MFKIGTQGLRIPSGRQVGESMAGPRGWHLAARRWAQLCCSRADRRDLLANTFYFENKQIENEPPCARRGVWVGV